MKREPTTKMPFFTKEEMEAAIAAAPDYVDDQDSPYDPNNAEEVRAYWANAKIVMPGEHRFQQKLKKPKI